jgi:RNA polymerase sigma-70 factor (sigma-E family)
MNLGRKRAGEPTPRARPADAAADREAFAQFVAVHRFDLLRTAAAMTGRPGADAEDLVQTALVRLAPVWSTVDSPLAYTRQIMSRLAIDAARAKQRRPEFLGQTDDDVVRFADQATPDASDHTALADELWRGLSELTLRQRQVLALRFFADCTEAETARILGCPAGTVKSEAHRGLKRLRAALNPGLNEPAARGATGGRANDHG